MHSQVFLVSLILICQASSIYSAEENSTNVDGRTKFVGSLLGMLGIGGRTPDPITGLTDKEIKLIQSSFNEIMKNPIENGMNIMINLLGKDPKYKKLFRFKDVPDDKLKDDITFKVQVDRIMYTLRGIIDHLGDSDLVMGLLERLAMNHKKLCVPPKGFQDIKVVILDILAPLFPSKTIEAWKKLLDVAFGYVSQQLS